MSIEDIAVLERVGMSEAIATCPDAVVVVGRDGTIYTVNAAITRLLGYAKSELIGKPISMLVPERIRDKHDSYFQGWLRHPKPRSMGADAAVTAQHKDGTELPVLISLSYVETVIGVVPMAWIREKT